MKDTENKGTLKNLSKYKSTISERLAYIPILDKRPDLAANYLTISDMQGAYALLKESFKEIAEGKRIHALMVDAIKLDIDNFEWYCRFFKQIEDNLLIVRKFNLPYNKCPEGERKEHVTTVGPLKEYIVEPELTAYQPFNVYYNGEKKKFEASPCVSNRKYSDPIVNYRIKYILDQHSIDEFKNCTFPGWYSLSNTTIYERYSYKTNTRIRIDFKDNKLYYFIAGASDNWKEIENVPEEMSYVVYALIFKNYMINTEDESI